MPNVIYLGCYSDNEHNGFAGRAESAIVEQYLELYGEIHIHHDGYGFYDVWAVCTA